MRIVSGIYKGRIIKAPDGLDTRPTTDRVRESMISSLISRHGALEQSNVLDLFAGSGALGMECISRGAASCTFCDKSKKALACIKTNIADLKIDSSIARVCNIDVMRSGIPAAKKPYGVVLLDPPYKIEPAMTLGLVSSAIAAGRIDEDATIVYEYGSSSISKTQKALKVLGFKVLSHKVYGSTCVDIIVKE